MKHLKKKKKAPLLLVLLILMAVIVVGLMIGMLLFHGSKETPTEPNGQTTSSEQSGPVEQMDTTEQTTTWGLSVPEESKRYEEENQTSTGPEDPQLPDCEVETPYGTLFFPGQWEDTIHAEIKNLDFGMDVVFYGTVDGVEYWLFTVHYGGADGIGVGAIAAKDGYFLDVTVELSDFIPDESWSEENANLFCAMQESVNHVMDKLKEAPAFQG